MPEPDSTAIAALESEAASPVYLIYLDLADGALRVTNYGQPITVSGSSDAELDGTYTAWGGQCINIGNVSNSDSGSEPFNITLSGIVTIDTDLLNDIGDRTKWQGRTCRVWCRLYDETGVTAQGAIFALYTGYMSNVKVAAAPEEQLIQLAAENWRAAFNNPSNRTYQGQKDYDSGDISAAATMAAANGLRRDSGAGVPGVGGGGFGFGGGISGGGLGGAYGSISQDGSSQSLVVHV